ncbi:hypothetical protein [Cystobacter fuscus]|uniref:hypothetical protein n=1 Tax=Cystobacter fuscus TaxID=43 RepID=UPI002B2D86D6|nr:hypothetical protein F0U63_14245 [Cystobacter fuscus]
MRNLLKSLLAATAVLALAPTTASARPPECYLVCDYEAFCEDTCWNGRITTCGEYGFCGASLSESSSDETASVAHDEAQQSDASSLVCDEARQDTEPSLSVES